MIGYPMQALEAVESEYCIFAAQKLVNLLGHLVLKDKTQRIALAGAYYTLAMQSKISPNQSKLYLNSAIAVLKKMGPENQTSLWRFQLAKAYFKRAELAEAKCAFSLAALDYHHAVIVLEQPESNMHGSDQDNLLFAQAAISIADIIVRESIQDPQLGFYHPVDYLQAALARLTQVVTKDDTVRNLEAYAYQITGMTLSNHDFEKALDAFRCALFMTFKTNQIRISSILADLYLFLGLLYEKEYWNCPIRDISEDRLEHAALYFSLSLFFTQNDIESLKGDIVELDTLFDVIYRALDPYLCPISHAGICDLIDALIFIYSCLAETGASNVDHLKGDRLAYSAILDAYAQHIDWLLREAHHKQSPRAKTVEILDPFPIDTQLQMSDILPSIKNIKANNVYYLTTRSIPRTEKF